MKEDPITVTILDRPYKLSAMSEQVEMFRTLACTIDKQARSFASSFPKRDSQDHIAMAALMVAMSLAKEKASLQETINQLYSTLENINSLITDSQN